MNETTSTKIKVTMASNLHNDIKTDKVQNEASKYIYFLHSDIWTCKRKAVFNRH